MWPRAYWIYPACCNLSAPSVTSSRPTPSVLAISSCVITSSLSRRPVQTERQPPTELLVQRMVSVAHRGLRRLSDERLGIAQQQAQHVTRSIEVIFQGLRLQPQTQCRAPHGSMWNHHP